MDTTSFTEILTMSEYMTSHPDICFVDLETTGIDPRKHKIVTICIYIPDFEPIVIDCRNLNMLDLGTILKPALESTVIVGMNYKFDWGFLAFHCGVRSFKVSDVMILEQILHGRGFGDSVGFSLADIAGRRGIEMSKEARKWFIDLDQRPEWNLPLPEEQIKYIEKDVEVLEPIYFNQLDLIPSRGLTDIVILETSFTSCLADMESNGMKIDEEKWRFVLETERKRIPELLDKATSIFGPHIMEAREPILETYRIEQEAWRGSIQAEETRLRELYIDPNGWGDFKREGMLRWKEANWHLKPKPLSPFSLNILSQKQLKMALENMRPDLVIPSTRDEDLEDLEAEIPQVDLIRELRGVNKLVTAYGDKLLSEKSEATGRFHFSYNQLVNTSRMSASRIQQIPARGLGSELRSCFVPEEGCKYCIGDYSQQEARIIADLANCKRLLQTFKDGKDIYSETVIGMLDLPVNMNTRKEIFSGAVTYRDLAKKIFLGLLYGMSSYGLALEIGVTKERAEELFEAFFDLYPEIRIWMEEQSLKALRDLKIRTDSGWERTFNAPPVIQRGLSMDEYKKAAEERRKAVGRIRRQGPNTRVQGLAASITKLAIILFYEQKDSDMLLVAAIHDELVVECPEHKAEKTRVLLSESMTEAAKYYLKRVTIPETEVEIYEYWSKS